MATWKSILRELDAANKRMVREAERQQRLALREQALLQKQDELFRAELEVEEFNERMSQLTTIHHDVGETLDWNEIVNLEPPSFPSADCSAERKALRMLNRYRPTWLQRLFGQVENKRRELEKNVAQAKLLDGYNNQKAIEQYDSAMEQWSQLHQMAVSINQGQLSAYQQAILEINPLSEIQEMGGEIRFSVPDSITVITTILVDGEKIVPRQIKTLTSRGKLSVKAMPKTKAYEVYEDFVCGCALRTARELFAILPIACTVVHIEMPLLDQATGYTTNCTILSVVIHRSILEQINISATDSSEAIKLFPHRVKFARTKGFSAVQPLSLSDC